jgi:PAS domain S-box-containing protein
MSRQIDRHFRTVLDTMTDGMLIEQGEDVAYLNPAYARMLGYPSVTELAGGTIREIADPEDFDRLRWFGLCRTTGRPAPSRYTFNARARGGRTVTFDASVSTIRIGGETLITTVVREIAKSRVVSSQLTFPGTAELSPRELEIVQLVLRGKRSKEIAVELDLSEKTVFTHRSRAYRKLSLRSDRELFRLAADLQLI